MKNTILFFVLFVSGLLTVQAENKSESQIVTPANIKDSKQLKKIHGRMPKLESADPSEQKTGPLFSVNIKAFKEKVNDLEAKRLKKCKDKNLKSSISEDSDSILNLKLFDEKKMINRIDKFFLF